MTTTSTNQPRKRRLFWPGVALGLIVLIVGIARTLPDDGEQGDGGAPCGTVDAPAMMPLYSIPRDPSNPAHGNYNPSGIVGYVRPGDKVLADGQQCEGAVCVPFDVRRNPVLRPTDSSPMHVASVNGKPADGWLMLGGLGRTRVVWASSSTSCYDWIAKR